MNTTNGVAAFKNRSRRSIDFCQAFSSPLQRVVPYILVLDQRSIFQGHIKISHVYLSPQTEPGCNSQGRCDYQGIGVSNALLRGCNNWGGFWLLLVVLVNPSRTSTCTRMDADRDNKREARKKLYFDRYSPVTLEMLMYGAVEKKKT